jgi:dihydroxycyclohexadiene carboxylate dehydrogenase
MGKLRFQDKVVVVTGAAQGIGEGVAVACAAEGAQVVLADRSDWVLQVGERIAASGHAQAAVMVDLETWVGAETLMRTAVERFGRIDVLINNVGGTIWAKPYEHYTADQIEAEVRRSLFPTLWCCRAALPAMLAQRQGTIVNVSSIATRSIHRVPYAAAKGGVNALTASLAMEHARNGIRVVATAPGGTDAPPRKVPRNQAPRSADEEVWYQAIVDQTIDASYMQRYGTIAEQVAPILFLASDEAAYITGSVLPVGGGDQGL